MDIIRFVASMQPIWCWKTQSHAVTIHCFWMACMLLSCSPFEACATCTVLKDAAEGQLPLELCELCADHDCSNRECMLRSSHPQFCSSTGQVQGSHGSPLLPLILWHQHPFDTCSNQCRVHSMRESEQASANTKNPGHSSCMYLIGHDHLHTNSAVIEQKQ
jgi:hypothetical protein